MQAVTFKDITIEGPCRVHRLLEFQMQVRPGRHASAEIYVMVVKEEWEAAVSDTESRKNIRISIRSETNGTRVLFAGVVKKAEFKREGELFFIRYTIRSASVLCDQEDKYRTFQDLSKTYAQIAELVLKDSNAVLMNTLITNEKPLKPMIQYAETDWKFLMRLASHKYGVLYPGTASFTPYLWMGLPDQEDTWEPGADVLCEEHGISSRYFRLGGSGAGYVPGDFEYYAISTCGHYEIGTPVSYQGSRWYIVEKAAKLIRGELVFTYRIAKKSYISTGKRFNPFFAGMSLLGKVMETSCETVKIQFDIDKEPQNECAYPYPWVPDTGSVMYCMPQIGSKVSVYFSGADEWSAKAVNCIRANGASCAGLSDPNQRSLTTGHGKELFLRPDSIGMSIGESANSFQLLDEFGVKLESGLAVKINGEEEICLKAKKIGIQTPSEINFVRQ